MSSLRVTFGEQPQIACTFTSKRHGLIVLSNRRDAALYGYARLEDRAWHYASLDARYAELRFTLFMGDETRIFDEAHERQGLPEGRIRIDGMDWSSAELRHWIRKGHFSRYFVRLRCVY